MSNAPTEIAALLQGSNKKVQLILLVYFLKNDGFKLQGEANA
ncbi:hypothetical protein AB7263_19460 [Providencia rettgeri]